MGAAALRLCDADNCCGDVGDEFLHCGGFVAASSPNAYQCGDAGDGCIRITDRPYMPAMAALLLYLQRSVVSYDV